MSPKQDLHGDGLEAKNSCLGRHCVVGAAGVELFNLLTQRKLVDSSFGGKGEKATIANSIVRLLYENPLT